MGGAQEDGLKTLLHYYQGRNQPHHAQEICDYYMYVLQQAQCLDFAQDTRYSAAHDLHQTIKTDQCIMTPSLQLSL